MPSSRFFDDGSDQYLVHVGAARTDFPISATVWFKSDDLTINQKLFAISDWSEPWQDIAVLGLQGGVAGDFVEWAVNDTGWGAAVTTLAYPANVWAVAHGISGSKTDHRAFINGANKGINSDDSGGFPTGPDRTSIGCALMNGGCQNPMSGNIALVIVRNVALNDGEVATEAAATTVAQALAVQSGAIVAYWLDGTEVDTDHENGFDMTPQNSPTWDSGDWPFAVGGETHQLAGIVAGVSALSGAMIATRGLAGIVGGVSTLSGVMAVVRSLAGKIVAASTLLGNLTATLSLSGQVDGASTLTGILRKIRSLAGQIAGQSSLSGTIALTKRLGGLVEALSGVSGSIDIRKALVGQINAISALTGTLTTVGEEITEIIELTGLLTKTIGVVGSFTKTGTVTGELVKEVEVIGQLRE